MAKPQPLSRADCIRFLATYVGQRPMMPAAEKNAFHFIDKFLREDLHSKSATPGTKKGDRP